MSTKGGGTAQNEEEVSIWTDSSTKDVIARVFDYGPGYIWIVSETVRPMQSEDEFEKLSHCNFQDMALCVEDSFRNQNKHSDLTKKIEELNPRLFRGWKGLLELGLEQSDLLRSDHWGKTSDGRIVVLDYGFTEKVWTNFYKEIPSSEEEFPGSHDFGE